MSNYQLTQSVVQGLLKDKNTIIDKFNSNRIVSIPQDIKLEIVDEVLILRAGSKVCVPVGFEEDGQTHKFSFITTTRDLSYTEPNKISATFPVYAYYKNGEIRSILRRGKSNSGTTVPSDNYNGAFYNTTTNNVEQYTNGSLSYISSLPLGLVSSVDKEGNNISAIDQIFNGFGYIGSTCYILPGITGYIPQGLNSDGTLINKIITQTKTSCTTVTSSWGTGSELFFFNGIDSYIHRASKNCFYQATQPIVNDVDNYWYNTETGKFYETKNSGSSWSEFKAIPAFTITFDEGKITSLKSCGVHELVNSNATNLSDYGRQVISGLGKPSSKYIDLTVGASGTTYIAPMNGYLYCSGHANASPAYISIDIPNFQYCGINGDVGHDLTTNQISLRKR